jgi:hypothetical protein
MIAKSPNDRLLGNDAGASGLLVTDLAVGANCAALAMV